MSSRQKKSTGIVMAVILVLALGLAGTFAASESADSSGNIEGQVDTSIFLHDDFSKTWDGDIRDRDVYVENTGDTSLYVRMRLDEFMRYGGKKLVGGEETLSATWKPHVPAGKDITDCGAEIHDYFKIRMGNDTGVKYKPQTKNAYDPAITEGDKTETTSAAKVVTIEEYLKAAAKPEPCWILDTADGYAYWHTQLQKGKATGLILNSITNTGNIDESYYYGINAKAEAVTEIDLNAWFHGNTVKDPVTGEKFEPASTNAIRLLKDMSPKYIKITEEMNLTTPPASDYDGDDDGYLTTKEYAEYQKLNPTLSLTDANAFPDEKFREALSDPSIDKDKDKALTMGEREAVTTLDLSNKGIGSLNGIERFPNLTDLNCSGNHLTKLNLTKNTALTSVNASGQTETLELVYDDVNALYKSKPNLFGTGTTFGVSEVTYDSGTGAAHVAGTVTDAQFDSSFSAPVTYGKSKATVNLQGTITFKKNPVVVDVKAKNVGDVVTIKNDTTNHPYGETTDWIILSKTDEEATLITKNIVTTHKYHTASTYPTWPKSDIRGWLNSAAVEGGTDYTGNGYMDTLGKDFKQVLKEETLQTAQAYNQWGPFNASSDKVYLLTETWPDSGKVGINPDQTAASSLMTVEQMKCSTTCDEPSKAAYQWWLRSPILIKNYENLLAATVWYYDATVTGSSSYVTSEHGVRPAVTIRLK